MPQRSPSPGTMGAVSLRTMPSEYAELNNLYVRMSLILRPFSHAESAGRMF